MMKQKRIRLALAMLKARASFKICNYLWHVGQQAPQAGLFNLFAICIQTPLQHSNISVSILDGTDLLKTCYRKSTLNTCRIRKPKTLREWGNVFSKPYESVTTLWRLKELTKKQAKKAEPRLIQIPNGSLLVRQITHNPRDTTRPSPLVRAT